MVFPETLLSLVLLHCYHSLLSHSRKPCKLGTMVRITTWVKTGGSLWCLPLPQTFQDFVSQLWRNLEQKILSLRRVSRDFNDSPPLPCRPWKLFWNQETQRRLSSLRVCHVRRISTWWRPTTCSRWTGGGMQRSWRTSSASTPRVEPWSLLLGFMMLVARYEAHMLPNQ